MKTLYVRIARRKEAERFYRCGIEFGRDWLVVCDLDDATAQRLEEEQMLEVTETRPAELSETPAGDSAANLVPPAHIAVPPAAAPEVIAETAAPEVIAEAAAPEVNAETAAPKKKAAK